MEDNQYLQFREEYERQHPASVPRHTPAIIGEYPGWVHYIVLAMFVSAAILSGVHTVPTVYDTIESGKVSEIVRQVAALLSVKR